MRVNVYHVRVASGSLLLRLFLSFTSVLYSLFIIINNNNIVIVVVVTCNDNRVITMIINQ